ncbi:Hypothetical predicted protein [Lecanosticta acicola]|uniref:Rhodopsin domain-containing protein n=1 Tax=Lecanosticta acicola TaxID=111012 RepID=A0AAI9EG34_9PEZI|nr:Hypothetical predicted protein [Lecanosticta acicola]
MSTQVYHDPSYMMEVWGIFGGCFFILAIRHFVRLRTAGLKAYHGDDYISILVIAFLTSGCVCITVVYHKGSNVDYIGKSLDQFSNAQIQDIVYASKLQKLCWYTYISSIWALKACLLFFYNRLTFGRTQRMLVRVLAVVCAVTIVCTTLNTVTDALILSIPVPLLFKLRVPLYKKIPLGVLLCSGIFVIAAAVARGCITVLSHPSALTVNRWGARETIAAITAVNAPTLKPLFTKSFWVHSSRCSTSGPSTADPNSDSNTRGNSDSYGTSRTGHSSKLSKLSKISGVFPRSSIIGLVNLSTNKTAVTTVTKAESEALGRQNEMTHSYANEGQNLIIRRPEPARRRETILCLDFDLERGPHPGIRRDAELGVVSRASSEEQQRKLERAETMPDSNKYTPYCKSHAAPPSADEGQAAGRIARIRSNTVG